MTAARRKRAKSRRHRRRRRTPTGSPPGTIVVDPEADPTQIRAVWYDDSRLEEREIDELAQLRQLLDAGGVLWVDIQGLGDGGKLEALGRFFQLHHLALEDVVNVHQRAKTEAYGDRLFIVARMIHGGEAIDSEQLSLFVGAGFVLTFQESAVKGDCFDPVRQRLRAGRSRIRTSGSDYLAYALLDALVDSYFPVLEGFGERLEALERDVLERPGPEVIPRLQGVRHDLMLLRRSTWPLRDAISQLLREDSPAISVETRVYVRDCYDHSIQVMDLIETYREIGSGLTDLYLSSLSNRMNDIMKVLTIIATIFIPLSFIAGLYGMNFDPGASPWNMPELSWYLGYPFALATMAAVAAVMLLYFRRRGWLGAREDDGGDEPNARAASLD